MNKTKRIVIDGMLIALYTVLSLAGAVTLGNMRITFEALPVLIAGMLLGPADGFIVGFLGSLVQQLVSYGLTPTTLLWIAPHALSGLLVGLLARKFRDSLDVKHIAVISTLSALTVTALNTLAMYVDSKMYGYYSFAYVFGSLLLRVAAGVATAVVFSLILPPVLRAADKALNG